MLKKIIYGLVIMVVISSLILISACRHSSSEKRMQWMMKSFSRDLKLTDLQKEQLDVYKTDMVIKGRELWVDYANTMDEMSLQLRSEEFDKEQLEDALSKTAVSQEEFISVFIERLGAFHSSLTPEQRSILVKKLDKMKRHKKGRCRYSM